MRAYQGVKFNGVLIRDEIARREQSIPEFAKAAGISPFSVYRSMGGGTARTKTLGKIARALCVEPSDLLLKESEKNIA